MPRITLNHQTFEVETLPDQAKVLIKRMRYAQSEIARLKMLQDQLNHVQCRAYEDLCAMLQSDPPPD